MGGSVDVQAAVGRVGVGGVEHADRAGVDDLADAVPASLHRLEDVDGADDVDERAERWIRTRERDLERREMDDVRDVVLVERGADGGELGDVAADEGNPGELVARHDEAEAFRVAGEVERDDRDALANEPAHRPRADAAKRAGDEEPLAGGCPCHDADAYGRQRFTSRPMPSISTTTSSPSASQTGGSRNAPTPAGVPVAMTSPGSSVKAFEQ